MPPRPVTPDPVRSASSSRTRKCGSWTRSPTRTSASRTRDILAYVDAVAKLGTASDLGGSEAASTLARLQTITGENKEEVGALASVIVRLGNEYAATESAIAANAQRVAQSTAAFEISSAVAAGFGAALRSIGVEADRGGTEVGRGFRRIDAATRQGGAALEQFASIAGTTTDGFRELFNEDQVGAFEEFIEGLGRIAEEGGDVAGTLEAIGLSGERSQQVYGTLAANSGVLGKALATVNDELRTGTALNEEAARAADTLGSDWRRLLTLVQTLAISTGEGGLTRSLRGVLQLTSDVIAALLNQQDAIQGNVVAVNLLAAAVKALGVVLAFVLAFKVKAILVGLIAPLGAVAVGIGGVSASLGILAGILGVILSPIGLIVGAVAAVVAGFQLFSAAAERKRQRLEALEVAEEDTADATKKFAEAQERLNEALEAGDVLAQVEALREQVDALREVRAEAEKALELDGQKATVRISGVLDRVQLDEEELERRLQGQLAVKLKGEIELGDGVSRDLAGQIAELLDRLPSIAFGEFFQLRADTVAGRISASYAASSGFSAGRRQRRS